MLDYWCGIDSDKAAILDIANVHALDTQFAQIRSKIIIEVSV